LQVLYAASDAGDLDIYLTLPDERLEDVAPTVAAAEAGTPSEYVEINRGSYRLRATEAGNKSELRLDVPVLTLGDRQIATLIVTPSSGGVLVNALLIDRGDAPVSLPNTNARVRAVIGVGGNPSASVVLAGNQLFAGTRVGAYQLVPTGNYTPVILVNGIAVASAGISLLPGTDRTLLVYGPAAAPLVSVLNDDNRLPAQATQTNVRLVHGVDGRGEGLTLLSTAGELARNVPSGTASAYGTRASGTALSLDVTSPASLDPISEFDNVTLDANGVYSVFVLGDRGAEVGILRKDR
jgi:hypothetical protein